MEELKPGRSMNFLAAFEDNDGSLAVLARDPTSDKVYKFTNCVPVSCHSSGLPHVELPKEEHSIEIPFTAGNSSEIDESIIKRMLDQWRSYVYGETVKAIVTSEDYQAARAQELAEKYGVPKEVFMRKDTSNAQS